MASPQTTIANGAQDATAALWLAGELLGSASLQMDGALLCIAGACTGCDPQAVLARLDAAALTLFGCDRLPCEAQAERLAAALTNDLGLTTETEQSSGLFVDRALTSHSAHPVLIAAIGHELARRAGLRSYVCRSARGWWTALINRGDVALVGTDASMISVKRSTMRGVCPHQLARVVLELLAADEATPLWRARAAELQRALPDCAAPPAR